MGTCRARSRPLAADADERVASPGLAENSCRFLRSGCFDEVHPLRPTDRPAGGGVPARGPRRLRMVRALPERDGVPSGRDRPAAAPTVDPAGVAAVVAEA